MQKKHFQQKRNGGSFKNRQNGKHNQVRFFKKRTAARDVEGDEVARLLKAYDEFEPKTAETFSEYPLSRKTQTGLRKGGYFKPTEIQQDAIGLALRGCDILGAAKTGSGKTLAFIIPVLERLHRERWTNMDGLGALVITPTRELAYQIFEVLKVVGQAHDFSAGLIIGGKDLRFERDRVDRCNIIICTPGRLLQHMDETPLFDCTNMKILVLDEADRILDLGFQETMNAIIDNLPPERQTLLFSATQTKSVKDLARLSLKDPEYVSVHENAEHSTPEALSQSYLVCDLHEKIDLLWSFIRNHRKQKILVFLSSCKQVKYTYEVFCRMRPGLSVLALYGSLHQLRRMAIYDDFCRKQTAVLLATDIAARGLDFPSVHWVVHLDCPEDVNTYIHRAGRTARYEEEGQSMLVLLPSEEKAMLEQLEGRKIPLHKTHVSQLKFLSVQRKMEALCARDVKLKESAQRAFVSYLKSVFLMKDKSIFAVQHLDIDAYARSLGLAVSPKVRFLQKHLKNLEAKGISISPSLNTSKSWFRPEDFRKPTTTYNFNNSPTKDGGSSEEEEEDFLTVRKVHMPSERTASEVESDYEQKDLGVQKVISKAAVARKLAKKKIKINKKITFTEDGLEEDVFPTQQKSEVARQLLKAAEDTVDSGLNLDMAKKIMEAEDKVDKKLFRKRIKELHKERKRKWRSERDDEEETSDHRRRKYFEETYEDDDHDNGNDQHHDSLLNPNYLRRGQKEKKKPVHDENHQLHDFKDSLLNPDYLRQGQKTKNKMDESSKDLIASQERDPKKKKTKSTKKRRKDSVPEDLGLSLEAEEELALHMLLAGK